MVIQKLAPITFMLATSVFASLAWGQSSKHVDDAHVRDSAKAQQQRLAKDTDVASELVDAYQAFIDEVRATPDRAEQVRVVDNATVRFNALLEPILMTDEVVDTFSLMVRVQLLNIDNSFLKVIKDHPNPDTRALALLKFAKHCSNNYRTKAAEKALLLLKKKYGTLSYKDDFSYAEAADHAIFFAKNLAKGSPAPNFVGKDADGVSFELKDYRGKVVMLRFWGDWCPPCRAMYDFERELVQKYKNKDFALIGVNSDSLKGMKAAQRRANLTWRSVWDGGDTGGPVAMLYQVESWPTIVVIDTDGTILFRSQGLAKPQLESVIERCLAEALAKK